MKVHHAVAFALSAVLAGCAGTPPSESLPARGGDATVQAPEAPRKGGGYYLDDGPGNDLPPNLDLIADAQPRKEPLHPHANKPYVALGREYAPVPPIKGFKQRGRASWYGKRFHGKKTSSGEAYDMYAMTAAHPTLPIPSYVRVVNPANGRSVVVRINDRGPFLHNRIIDLSYAAAHRLGYIQQGSAIVEVEAVLPPEEKATTALSESVKVADTESSPANVYVQLGAFSSRASAENLKARIAGRAAELAEMLSIIAGDGLFRVHLGPYKSREDTGAVVSQLRSLFDLQPQLVVR
ncbi:MAG TPA: septal ring lytic transglycosylase RlpA family protein [Burkholderiales bacterium]|nr:septal ring lytic transglycosylase RlpA family protein [Burkholderiales bacterium]